jgi:NADP-dependent 3-hydroxy acid dehydrogenase YdfG
MMDRAELVAVVTGASAGIGLAQLAHDQRVCTFRMVA